MIRSLAVKWIITLLLTSLIGVILIGLFAYRAAVSGYDRLRVEQAQTIFVNDASTYYQEHQGWEGFQAWLHDQQPMSKLFPFSPQLFALADADAVVVAGFGPFHLNQPVSPQQLDEGIAIVVDGERVGTALLAMPPPALDIREQRYLDLTYRALLVAALGAGSAALLFGILLSRHFLRPLGELTSAIKAMKQGDLSQQVRVRTHDELGELAQTFNQMSAEIYRVNHLRKQMTADVAHDLRTPLTVITGYLEALRDGTLKPTRERFDLMYNETTLLKRLIDDLRTLSLADAGELKLVYQSLQPVDLLEQVNQAFEPIAAEQKIQLQVQADSDLPRLQVDRERMAQVLGNLVSNALRYTPTGGTVTLQARQRSNRVQLVVSDTGTGIPEDKLPNIFERFYRIEEARTQIQGESGLGLAIAKSIVEAHQGTIAAESHPGRGTSITITLPPEPAKPLPGC